MKFAFDVNLCTLKLFEREKGEALVFRLGPLTELPEGVEVDKKNTYLVFDDLLAGDGTSCKGKIYSGDYDEGPFYQIGEALLSEAESLTLSSIQI